MLLEQPGLIVAASHQIGEIKLLSRVFEAGRLDQAYRGYQGSSLGRPEPRRGTAAGERTILSGRNLLSLT